MRTDEIQSLAADAVRFLGDLPDAMLEEDVQERLALSTIELSCASADLIRIVIFGEFNSGKSSLLNALLGHDIAPIDFLEKTAHVVRYFPHHEPIAVIHRRGDAPITTRPSAASAAAMEELLETYDPTEVRRVDIGLPYAGTYVLVDTPGVGSLTLANQMLAMDGLREAHAVLVCIAADSVGSSAEIGTATALVGHGMPVLCALTRTDLLNGADEQDEVCSWLHTSIGLPRDDILPVGGLHADGTPTGLDALAARLAAIGADSIQVRMDSERAQSGLLRDQVRDALDQTQTRLATWQADIGRAEKLIRTSSAAVEQRTCARLIDDVQTRLFEPRLRTVIGNPAAGLAETAGGADASPDSADEAVGREWARLTYAIPDMVLREWEGHADSLRGEVERLCAEAESVAGRALAAHFDPNAIVASIEERGRRAFGEGIAVSMTAAVGGTAVSTVAAGAGLGAALTGVGLPIAAAGALLSAMWARRAARREKAKADVEVRKALSELRDQFIEEVLEPHVFPQIRTLNAHIADELIDAAVRRVTPFTSTRDLEETTERLDAIVRRSARS